MRTLILVGVIVSLAVLALVAVAMLAYVRRVERSLTMSEWAAGATVAVMIMGQVLNGLGTYAALGAGFDSRTMLITAQYKYQHWRANSSRSDSTGMTLHLTGRRNVTGNHLSEFDLTIYPRYRNVETQHVRDHLLPDAPRLRFTHQDTGLIEIDAELALIRIDRIEERLLQAYDGRDPRVTSRLTYELYGFAVELEYHGAVRGTPFRVSGLMDALPAREYMDEVVLLDRTH